MPYLTNAEKILIENEIKELVDYIKEFKGTLLKPGTLNYITTRLFAELVNLEVEDSIKTRPTYHQLSQYRAAINDSSDEIYRRVFAPAEDNAIQRNGDVKELKALVEKIKPPVA